MTNEQSKTEQLPQRPDLAIETIKPANAIMVTDDQLPWITDSELTIPTVGITTIEGLQFRYGSVVKGNGSIEDIAGQVPPKDSASAEETMFKSLPHLFDMQLPPNIDRVGNVSAAWPVFKVTKKGPDAPRLLFTWYADEAGTPVVLKLAITKHKKQSEMFAVLQKKSSHRKHDGRSR